MSKKGYHLDENIENAGGLADHVRSSVEKLHAQGDAVPLQTTAMSSPRVHENTFV